MLSEQPKNVFYDIPHYPKMLGFNKWSLYMLIVIASKASAPFRQEETIKGMFHSHIYYLYILKFLSSVWFLDLFRT